MSDQSLDMFFDNLVQVLMQDVAFYIPSTIIPKNVVEIINSEIGEGFFDQLSILDIANGIGFFEIDEFNERLLLKRRFLDKNIFQLLKKKKELDDFEFNYILGKYFDQVEFYSAIVNWLSINLSLYHKNEIDYTTNGCFELQNEFYKSHFIELINLFYPSQEVKLKELYDLSQLLNLYFPDLISRYDKGYKDLMIASSIEIPQQEFAEGQKSNLKEEEIAIEENLDTIKSKPKKKIKKGPLFTDKEAEDFLLTTVFNIKLGKTIEKDINKI